MLFGEVITAATSHLIMRESSSCRDSGSTEAGTQNLDKVFVHALGVEQLAPFDTASVSCPSAGSAGFYFNGRIAFSCFPKHAN